MVAAITIRCLCGAVEMDVTGEPMAQFYCHCDDCQAMSGGAYVPEVVFKSENVIVKKGETRAFTIKRNPRHACAVCNARLFVDVVKFGLRGINGYLMPPSGEGQFVPQFHVHCRFAVLPVKDDLPHYAGMPAMFRGSDERVAW